MNTAAIKARKSVRTFTDQPVAPETIAELERFIANDANPFGVPITFRILDREKYGLSSPVILGAKTYIGAKCKRQEHAELAFGYSFEKFVLFATTLGLGRGLGLGTVWLAGTLDRKAFEKAMDVAEDEMMPAVAPIGYAAEKKSKRETLMRKKMKSDERVPFDELFFADDFGHPLTEANAGALAEPLQMVRWAPSATNKQPWRVVVDGNKVHFYERKSKGYAREATGDIQKVDLGIALCHFEIAAKEAGLVGTFAESDPGIEAPDRTAYVITYTLDGPSPLN